MVKRDKHLFMLLRVTFFTVVLLVSATVQARTPYESTAHDRIVQTFRPELPALSDRLLPEEVAVDGVASRIQQRAETRSASET